MITVHPIQLISSDPAVRGGRPCVAGTGIRVSDLVGAALFHGQTPADIAVNYDLSLAQVHAAFAHYYLHQSSIDAELRDDEAEFTARRADHANTALLP